MPADVSENTKLEKIENNNEINKSCSMPTPEIVKSHSCNSSQGLFRYNQKSKFEFVITEDESNNNNNNCSHQSKFLQQYYIRYSFSNLVKIPSKILIEEEYFTKLKNNIVYE